MVKEVLIDSDKLIDFDLEFESNNFKEQHTQSEDYKNRSKFRGCIR